jgi:hypothetical protein
MAVPLTFGDVVDAAGGEDRTGTATAAAAAAAAPAPAKTVQVLDSPIIGKVPFCRAPRTLTLRQLRRELWRFAGYARGSWYARVLAWKITLMRAVEDGCGRCGVARHPAKPRSTA